MKHNSTRNKKYLCFVLENYYNCLALKNPSNNYYNFDHLMSFVVRALAIYPKGTAFKSLTRRFFFIYFFLYIFIFQIK